MFNSSLKSMPYWTTSVHSQSPTSQSSPPALSHSQPLKSNRSLTFYPPFFPLLVPFSHADSSNLKLSLRQCNNYSGTNCDFSSSSDSTPLSALDIIFVVTGAFAGLLILAACFRHFVAYQNTITPPPPPRTHAAAPPPISRTTDVLDPPPAYAPAALPMRTVEQVDTSVGDDLVRRVDRAPP